MKTWKKTVVCIFCILAMTAGVFTGCTKKNMTDAEYEEIAKNTAKDNAKKVVMKITKGDKSYDITLDMLTYFLMFQESEGLSYYQSNKDMFASLYGTMDFWSIPVNETTKMRDSYKNAAYNAAVNTLLLYFEASEAGMTLTDNRKSAVEMQTTLFLGKYSPAEKARAGCTEEVIRANYERVFLAEQFLDLASSAVEIDTEAVKASVNKEDYRSTDTTYIYLSKDTENETYNQYAGSVEDREKLMTTLFEEAKNGKSLEDIQKEHADILTLGTRGFQKGNATSIEPDYIENAEAMKVGECRLLDYNYGIYIVRLDDNTKYYGYDDAVQAALEEAQNKGVSDVYVGIIEKYNIETTDAWNDIEMGTILNAPKK